MTKRRVRGKNSEKQPYTQEEEGDVFQVAKQRIPREVFQPLEVIMAEQVSTLKCVDNSTMEKLDIPEGSCRYGESM